MFSDPGCSRLTDFVLDFPLALSDLGMLSRPQVLSGGGKKSRISHADISQRREKSVCPDTGQAPQPARWEKRGPCVNRPRPIAHLRPVQELHKVLLENLMGQKALIWPLPRAYTAAMKCHGARDTAKETYFS